MQDRVENLKNCIKESERFASNNLVNSKAEYEDAHNDICSGLGKIDNLFTTEIERIQSTIHNDIQQSSPQPNKQNELNISMGAPTEYGKESLFKDVKQVPAHKPLSYVDQAVAETFGAINSELQSMESSVAGRLDEISRSTEAQCCNLRKRIKAVSHTLVLMTGHSDAIQR